MRAYSLDDVLADKALPLLSRKSSSVSTVRALVLFEDVGAREMLEAGFADVGFVVSVCALVRPDTAVLREGLEAGCKPLSQEGIPHPVSALGSAHFLPIGTAALVFMSMHSFGH